MEKINTSMERFIRQLPSGLYKEFYLLFVHYVDNGGNILRSNLNKVVPGKLYRMARSEEDRCIWGNEMYYKFPNDKNYKRFIPVSN